eukprot:6491652-Amphidinium_carterae.2
MAETRVQQTQIPAALATAESNMYSATFVPALLHGAGVGAVVHQQYELQTLWTDAQGRGAVMVMWTGSHTLAIGLVYGWVNREDHALTAALVQDIVERMRPFYGMPCLLAGDFNMNVSDLPAVAMLYQQGWARIHGADSYTCYPEHGTPSSIDAMVGNALFQARVTHPTVIDDLVFKPHRTISVQYEAGTLRYPQLSVPPVFDAIKMKARQTDVNWNDVAFTGDLDADYATWNTSAMGELVGASEHRTLRQRQQQPSVAVKTASMSTAAFAEQREGPIRRTQEQELQHRLHELILAVQRGLPLKQRSHLVAIQRNPVTAELDLDMAELSNAVLQGTMQQQLATLAVAKLQAEEIVTRTRQQQKQLQDEHWKEWHHRHMSKAGSVAFKAIKNRPFPAPSALKINGEVQTEPQVIMDGLATFWRSYWLRAPTLTLQDACQTYPQQPQPQYPISVALNAADVATVIRAQPAKARGLDYWHADELKLLSQPCLQHLADLLNACQVARRWPKQLQATLVVLKPKKENCQVLADLRPLALLPQLYRLWAKIYVHRMRPHFARRAHTSNAAKPGTSIRAALREFVVSMEIATSKGEHVAGFHSDLAKAYEVVRLDLLEYVLLSRGWPPEVVALMIGAYKHKRYMSYKGWATEVCEAINGITAGCPLAVWALCEYMSSLASYMSIMLYFRQYVDDCAMKDSSRAPRELAEMILEAIEQFREWLDTHGLDINEQKSVLWSSHPLTRKLLQDTPYAQEDSVRDLGYDLTFAGTASHSTTEQRVKDVMYSCRRLELLRPPRAISEALVQRSVLVKALWGCEFQALPQGLLDKLRHGISRALGFKKGQGRTTYATQVLSSRHIIHPTAVLYMAQLAAWHEFLCTQPPAAQVQLLWRRGLEKTAFNMHASSWAWVIQHACHALGWVAESAFTWSYAGHRYTLAN